MIALAKKKNPLAKEVGQRIQARRKQLRLTQEQLAERADLSPHFITCVGSGIKGLGDESIIKLSEGLQVSADYILFGTPSDQNHRWLAEMIQPLNEQELLGLEEIIRAYLKACGHLDW